MAMIDYYPEGPRGQEAPGIWCGGLQGGVCKAESGQGGPHPSELQPCVVSDRTILEKSSGTGQPWGLAQPTALWLCRPGPLLHFLCLRFFICEMGKIKSVLCTVESKGDPREGRRLKPPLVLASTLPA